MNRISLLTICSILSLTSFGQDTIGILAKAATHNKANPDTIKRWNFNGFVSINLNQAYFNNWAPGGENSMGLASLINVNADYKKGHHSWTNKINLAYGFMINALGSSTQRYNKTDDRILFTTVYGYGLSEHWDFSLLVNFQTQFSNGYKYPNDSVIISRFMAPGYFITGPGISWKPAASFGIFMSPVTTVCIFVLDESLAQQGAYGVDTGKQFRGEFGAYAKITLNKDLTKNINISSTLDLFTNYLRDFGSIDFNWNMLMTMKASKWLTTTLSACLFYDDRTMITDKKGKTGPRTQIKENLGVGISYKIH